MGKSSFPEDGKGKAVSFTRNEEPLTEVLVESVIPINTLSHFCPNFNAWSENAFSRSNGANERRSFEVCVTRIAYPKQEFNYAKRRKKPEIILNKSCKAHG